MATFLYEALREPGKPVRGEIDADNAHAAATNLVARGYHVLRVEDADAASGRRARPRLGGFGGLKHRDLVRTTRDCANLLRAGLPLSQALATLANRTDGSVWPGMLRGVRSQLEDGRTFSEALGTYPDVFNPMYVNLVNAGERSGNLVEVLTRLAEIGEKQEEIRSRVKMAMVYPGVMLSVGALTVFVLISFVVPMFTDVFKETGQVLPFPTRVIVGLSDFMQVWWYMVALGIAGAVYFLRVYFRSAPGKRLLSAVVLRVPVLNQLIRKTELASFSQTLSTLLHSGLPIISSLDITASTLRNAVFSSGVHAMVASVREGGLLSEAMAAQPIFPQMTASIVYVGERSGELTQALQQLSTEYEREVDRQVKVVMALVEPLMIILLGVVVGFIVLAMLLPIFELGDTIQG